MIHGYRTVFDLGGLVSPLTQIGSAQARREPDTQSGTAAASSVQTAGKPERVEAPQKSVNQPQTASSLTSQEDPMRGLRSRTGPDETATPGSVTSVTPQEPSLPQLSAEALATALMTAEPDKALVPRVLPADPTEPN